MAQILNFQQFRSAKQFRDFSQQASHTVMGIALLKSQCSHMDTAISEMQSVQLSFCDDLDNQQEILHHTLMIAHSCSDACELETIEEMVEARDKILQTYNH